MLAHGCSPIHPRPLGPSRLPPFAKASLLRVAFVRLHVGKCCWLGEGPWAFVTPVKAIGVEDWEKESRSYDEADDWNEVDVWPGSRSRMNWDNEAGEGREASQRDREQQIDGHGVEGNGAKDGDKVDTVLDLDVRNSSLK